MTRTLPSRILRLLLGAERLRELLLVEVAEVDEELPEVLARIVRGGARPRRPSRRRIVLRTVPRSQVSEPVAAARESSSTRSASGRTAKLPMRPRMRAECRTGRRWRQARAVV